MKMHNRYNGKSFVSWQLINTDVDFENIFLRVRTYKVDSNFGSGDLGEWVSSHYICTCGSAREEPTYRKT